MHFRNAFEYTTLKSHNFYLIISWMHSEIGVFKIYWYLFPNTNYTFQIILKIYDLHMYINTLTVRIVIITPNALWNVSPCRVWTLSTQSYIAYHYFYITHKGRKQFSYIQKLNTHFLEKKSIVRSFIKSRVWRIW